MTRHRVEWEGLPGFVRWATPADGIATWDPRLVGPPAAWFTPSAGWGPVSAADAGRVCSGRRCRSQDLVGELRRAAGHPAGARRRAAAPLRISRSYVYCARHAADYGVHVVGGRLLCLRWWNG